MSRWWRAYDEAVDDPKLILLTDRQHRAWFNLCCITSQNGGVLPGPKIIALKLRTTLQKTKFLVAELTALGLIDHDNAGNFAPHNWEGRQYKSDKSDPTAPDRMRRYRNKHRNADRNATVTPTVTVTAPDTDTEAERKKDPLAQSCANALEPDFLEVPEPVDEDPKAKLFRIAKTILVSFGIPEKLTGALIGQWLKTRNDPAGLLAAIQYARDQNVAEPIAYISTLVSKAKNPNGQHGKQDLSAMCFAVADELLERERSQSAGRPVDPSRSDPRRG